MFVCKFLPSSLIVSGRFQGGYKHYYDDNVYTPYGAWKYYIDNKNVILFYEKTCHFEDKP